MTKREELEMFIARADELISSKYIVADIKIVNLLKSIAVSNTLLALFKSCVADFDYEEAKSKYFVQDKLVENKGEFVLPNSPKDLIAVVFNVLMDIDSKRINFSSFLDKYFYEDGSVFNSFCSFSKDMIMPFRDCVKNIMESVIEGKLQDPIDALREEEIRAVELKRQQELEEKAEKELSSKSYGSCIKKAREYLLIDKKKVKDSNLSEEEKNRLSTVIDMLANVLDGGDKDAIEYAYTAYYFAVTSHKILFFNRKNKMNKLIEAIKNGL